MRKSLVFKLFLLTAALCIGLLVLVAVGQSYFFGHFYVESKVETLAARVSDYVPAHGSELEFYEKNQAWIASLDSTGTISNFSGYSVSVQLEGGSTTMDIPLYTMEGEYGADASLLLRRGEEVFLDAVEANGQLISYQLMSQYDSLALVNMSLANKLNGIHADPAYAALETRSFAGTIVALDFPSVSETTPFPLGERTFIEQVKAFQVELLRPGAKPITEQTRFQKTVNSIEYQIIVEPKTQSGDNGYLFAMTSLQPVGEAVSALTQFYPLFFAAALLLVLAAALIYSKWLANPLLSISRVTQKITELDFTETLPVRSGDELGQLSANINRLSGELKAHIGQLQNELDREKQLEQTRKRFISDVSHELKTPLAVMKSCLSILEDGIAADKRAYYFSAMKSKVEEMDALVMDMLELAKMESGTFQPELSLFSLDATLHHICGAFEPLLLKKGLRLSLNIPPVMAIGYEPLIARVVSNFMSNAVQHTEPAHMIAVSVSLSGATAMVSVENEGEPLSEDAIAHVWEQFYRVRPEAGDGTGLGLAICKGILVLHHAEYGVENTASGVRFYFSLPFS